MTSRTIRFSATGALIGLVVGLIHDSLVIYDRPSVWTRVLITLSSVLPWIAIGGGLGWLLAPRPD